MENEISLDQEIIEKIKQALEKEKLRYLKVKEILNEIGDKVEELKDLGILDYRIASKIEYELYRSKNKDYDGLTVNSMDIEVYLIKKREEREKKECCDQ